MNNDEVTKIAEKVLENSDISKEEKFGNILVIIMVIGIIINVIRVIQECEEDKRGILKKKEYCSIINRRVIDIAKRKNAIDMIRLKRILIKHLGRDGYNQYKDKLTHGLLKTGSELTENETYTLLEHSDD